MLFRDDSEAGLGHSVSTLVTSKKGLARRWNLGLGLMIGMRMLFVVTFEPFGVLPEDVDLIETVTDFV